MGGKSKIADEDQPWISNYRPLQDFLREIDARCDWQIPYGPRSKPTMYVEQWRAPGSAPFIIVVRSNKHGWDIYTSELSNKIDAAIEDARRRIFHPTGPMDEGGE